jgi:hypothetical protein
LIILVAVRDRLIDIVLGPEAETVLGKKSVKEIHEKSKDLFTRGEIFGVSPMGNLYSIK